MKEYGKPIFGSVSEANPIVKTTHGEVKGFCRNGIASFWGIPYGENCSGERRFLPPLPAGDWDGIKDCTGSIPTAVQAETKSQEASNATMYFVGGKPEMMPETYQSENCLVVNVLTPGLDDRKRPVMVYLHGGGFESGSGVLLCGADAWAREEDVVLVSVNHRLNVFGYLYLGAFDEKYAASGNAGIQDLILALQWVRDNIASFGGDPAQVTLFGESGGGQKICIMLDIDAARGLFSKAIVESGSAPVGKLSKTQATKAARLLLQELGVDENDLTPLLHIPERQIYDAYVRARGKLSDGWSLQFGPVGDDITIPFNEAGTYREPKPSRDIPLIVGSSEDESGLIFTGKIEDVPITWENLRDMLLDAGSAARGDLGLLHWNEGTVDAVIEGARATNHKNESAAHTYLKIISQAGFLGSGSYYQAETKARQGGAPVFYYTIRYDAPNLLGIWENCAWHTADLALQMRMVYKPECEYMSRMLAHSYAAFARTGNPSTERIAWPAFTVEEKLAMVMDDEWHVEKDPLEPLRAALEKSVD